MAKPPSLRRMHQTALDDLGTQRALLQAQRLQALEVMRSSRDSLDQIDRLLNEIDGIENDIR